MVRAEHEFCGPMMRNTIWDRILHMTKEPVWTCRGLLPSRALNNLRQFFVEFRSELQWLQPAEAI